MKFLNNYSKYSNKLYEKVVVLKSKINEIEKELEQLTK